MNEQEKTFSAGDRVTLKSGSPRMTVLDVGRDTGQVWCRWMNETGSIMEAAFPAPTLGRVRIGNGDS